MTINFRGSVIEITFPDEFEDILKMCHNKDEITFTLDRCQTNAMQSILGSLHKTACNGIFKESDMKSLAWDILVWLKWKERLNELEEENAKDTEQT